MPRRKKPKTHHNRIPAAPRDPMMHMSPGDLTAADLRRGKAVIDRRTLILTEITELTHLLDVAAWILIDAHPTIRPADLGIRARSAATPQPGAGTIRGRQRLVRFRRQIQDLANLYDSYLTSNDLPPSDDRLRCWKRTATHPRGYALRDGALFCDRCGQTVSDTPKPGASKTPGQGT